MIDIEKIVEIFPLAQLQDAIALITVLEQEGYTFSDLRNYVDIKRKKLVDREKIRDLLNIQVCPACGSHISIMPVNNNPRNQTGDDSTFVWFCSCGYEDWTNKALEEIIQNLTI